MRKNGIFLYVARKQKRKHRNTPFLSTIKLLNLTWVLTRYMGLLETYRILHRTSGLKLPLMWTKLFYLVPYKYFRSFK